jgi:hypothetical protein
MKSRSGALTAIFFALTIASIALLVPTVLNYLEFYNAITKFDLRATEAKLDKSLIERLEIIVAFNLTVSNPTGFSGLTVQSISSKLYYEDGEHLIPVHGARGHGITGSYKTTWWELENSQTPCSKRLEPHQNVTIPITIHISTNVENIADSINAINFMSFIESYEGNINFRLESAVQLSTFLGGYTVPFDIYAQVVHD